jgi:TPP-dependent indolepyruvate ferredoxin oxidoreductase alpha subunit
MATMCIQGEAELAMIETIQKLDIKDGDILKISCPFPLSGYNIDMAEKHFEQKFKDLGKKVKIIILDSDVTITH